METQRAGSFPLVLWSKWVYLIGKVLIPNLCCKVGSMPDQKKTKQTKHSEQFLHIFSYHLWLQICCFLFVFILMTLISAVSEFFSTSCLPGATGYPNLCQLCREDCSKSSRNIYYSDPGAFKLVPACFFFNINSETNIILHYWCRYPHAWFTFLFFPQQVSSRRCRRGGIYYTYCCSR